MQLNQQLAIKYIRAKFKLLSSLSKIKTAEKAFDLFCTPQRRTRKEFPPVFKLAEKMHFPFGGSIVHGFRWNHPASRKVLILHGFESGVVNFDQYVSALVNKGYEVLAFDAPAHGRSTGERINVLTYRDMVQHIIVRYGPIQSFIAHSFGGLCLSLALENIPHDRGWRVVLIAPATETTRAIDNFFRFLRLDKEVRAEFDRIIKKAGERPASWYSVARAAGQIRAQVLFVQDKEDELTPLEDVEPIMEKGYPNFRFIITEGLGHSRIYREEKVVQEIVDFIGGA